MSTFAPPPVGPAGLPGLPGVARCLVMGIINVTPDSFSDGGRWLEADRAVQHGLNLLACGADLLDVGGESTRPGAGRVAVEEELRRTVPVVRALAEAGAVVGVDTMRARVALAALEAGAALVNDVSGGLADPGLVEVVAQARVPYVVMHWRGQSEVMESLAVYDDVVAEVVAELRSRVDALVAAGVDERHIILDPGFGFAKRPEHNWRLLAELPRLVGLGHPVLVGTSRKRFLAQAVPQTNGLSSLPAAGRDDATAATSALAAAAGVWAVRVHEPAPSAAAVRVVHSARESLDD